MEKVINNSYKILLHITLIAAATLVFYSARDILSNTVILIGSYILFTGLILIMVVQRIKKSYQAELPVLKNEEETELQVAKLEVEKKEVAFIKSKEEVLNELLQDDAEKLMVGNILSKLADRFKAVQGVYYHREGSKMHLKATYATVKDINLVESLDDSEGFIGASILSRKTVILNNVPSNYFKPFSGLGDAVPGYLIFIPIIDKNAVIGVFELASFKQPSKDMEALADHVSIYFSQVIIKSVKEELKKAV